MLLINTETRITFLLPAFVLTAHTLYSLGAILRLLADSQRMYNKSISVFKEEAYTELLTIQKNQYDQNQSAVLREFQQIASSALNSGDVSQYAYAQGYFEAYLDVVLAANSHDGLKNLIVAYEYLITTTQIVDRNAIYQKVITKIFNMYVIALRLQKYDQAEEILRLLVSLQWPLDQHLSSHKPEAISDIVQGLFLTDFRYLLYDKQKHHDEYLRWIRTTIAVVNTMVTCAIHHPDKHQIVRAYLITMYELVEGACHEINNSVKHTHGDFPYEVAREVDACVLHSFATAIKSGLNHDHVNREMCDAIIEVSKASPTFYWLTHAIVAWRWIRGKRIEDTSDQIIMSVNNDESIHFMSVVIMLIRLQAQNCYSMGMAYRGLITPKDLQEFKDALADHRDFINAHQPIFSTYIPDIISTVDEKLLPNMDIISQQFSLWRSD
jgi:hypothetical protein